MHMRTSLFVFTVLMALLATALPAASQDNGDDNFAADYTDLRIGDSVQLLESEGGAEGALYMFVDAKSCFTCIDALGAIERFVKEQHKVDFTVFLLGKSQEYADLEKEHNGWSFRVIADPFYLYRKFYKVKVLPFFFLAGANGKVLLEDKCGGGHVSLSQIDGALSSSMASRISSPSSLKPLNRVIIHKRDGAAVVFGENYYILFDPSSHNYTIIDASFKRLYRANAKGAIIKEIDLTQIDAPVTSPLPPTWIVPDSIILGVDVGTNPPGRRVMYSLNIRSGHAHNFNFSDSGLYPPYIVLENVAYNPTAKNIVAGIRSITSERLDTASPSLVLLDQRANVTKRLSHVDTLFREYAMNTVLNPKIGVDSRGNIFEIQSPTRRLNIYSPDGVLSTSLRLDFGSYWKDFAADLAPPDNRSMEDWVFINRNTSFPLSVFPSSNGREVAVVYLNTDYPDGITDPLSGEARKRPFLHRSSLSGQRIGSDDIPLPEHSKTFFVDGPQIGIGEYRSDHLEIAWYEAPSNM